MVTIKSVIAHEILDSRGNPTIETQLWLDNDQSVTTSVPSGASTSSFESVELRDNDKNRFEGKGVKKACEVVNNVLSKAIVGQNPIEQTKIDNLMIEMDGTENKSKLGGNSILSVSQAVVKAAALSQNLKVWEYLHGVCVEMGMSCHVPTNPSHMPTPTFNIINGGLHGGGNIDFQEYHIIPSTNIAYSKALEIGQETYEKLKDILAEMNLVHTIGDEGGFSPNLNTNLEGLDLIEKAIRLSGNELYKDANLGIDVASTNFFNENQYTLKDQKYPMKPDEWLSYLLDLQNRYKLSFIEDGISEDDWGGWVKLNGKIGNQTMVVGDDFLATNFKRVKKAIEEKAANTVLIKPNQAGTVTETLNVIKLAKDNFWKIIVSHRSGETNDTFIADLSVGVDADFVKFGAPSRGERVAKYNRLLEIEREIGIA